MLGSEPKEIPCVDKVDKTQGTFKWSEKGKESLKKMNSDCNLTAGLEAVLQVAVEAQVMMCRNIDVSSGLVMRLRLRSESISNPFHLERAIIPVKIT